MTKQRPVEGFAHQPDAIKGVDAKFKRTDDGVSIGFGDGSEPLNVSRREFMRISGVAAATAAMTGAGCSEFRNDVDYLEPYVDRPEEIRVGSPNYYASVCSGCAAGCGVLVTSRGGRPVKLEGNPQHPLSKGGLCSRGQASYMNLYDPDRAAGALKVAEGGAHQKIAWDELDRAVIAAVEKGRSGGGIGILTKTFSGSARQALVQQIQAAVPKVKHYAYDALASEALLKASEACYGSAHVPHYDFSKADYIVSLGSDFLGTWLSPVEFTKQFSSRRDPEGNFNKLVAFEGAMTLTGANADERHRVRPDELVYIGLAIAHTVMVTRKTGPLANSGVVRSLAAFTPEAVAGLTGVSAEELTKVGQDLADHAGKSLVVAGGLASGSSTGVALEAVVNILNATLGNEGVTIDRSSPSNQQLGSLDSLKALIADINAGKIDTLIIDGANPVYSAPQTLGLKEALEKVAFVVSTTDRVDETSVHADYLAPAGHALEAWGDSNPVHGVYAIQQPTVQPLHDTRGFEHSLMVWFGQAIPNTFDAFLAAPKPANENRAEGVPTDPGPWYRYIRQHWNKAVFPLADGLATFDSFWKDTLRRGVFVSRQKAPAAPSLNASQAASLLPSALPEAAAAAQPSDFSKKKVQLFASATLYDGEAANNGHLQETPDVITKHVWGSYVMVSNQTFKQAGLKQGQYLSVKVGDFERTFPVIVQPGLHDDIIAIPLGYGRTAAGVVGNDVGANGFLFTSDLDGVRQFAGIEAEIKALNDGEQPAIVQGAQVLDINRRSIFGLTSLEEYKADQGSGIHQHSPLPDLWNAHGYTTKWGMAVDMSKCTGCSACVTACQEENNIPVVGRQGILEGREMHWMRIDRYYILPNEADMVQKHYRNDPMLEREPVVSFGDYIEDKPRVAMQPMMCQHCENAPCETVCPVAATMHSADGLNQMAYNRCVGTRYCSNNCPYKVRRYNWFSYTTSRADTIFARLYPELKDHERYNVTEPLPRGYNPEVTVRSRGVMEKCTFCVQRIRRASWQMKEEGRSKFADGDVVPACQQSCPADAIVFGNLADETSAVAKMHAKARAASPLKEVGVESSVAYMTSVWNTKPRPGGHHGGHDDHAAADHEEAAH